MLERILIFLFGVKSKHFPKKDDLWKAKSPYASPRFVVVQGVDEHEDGDKYVQFIYEGHDEYGVFEEGLLSFMNRYKFFAGE